MCDLTLGMLDEASQNESVEEQMAAMSLADVKTETECSSHRTNTGGTSGEKDEGKAVRDRSRAEKIKYHMC